MYLEGCFLQQMQQRNIYKLFFELVILYNLFLPFLLQLVWPIDVDFYKSAATATFDTALYFSLHCGVMWRILNRPMISALSSTLYIVYEWECFVFSHFLCIPTGSWLLYSGNICFTWKVLLHQWWCECHDIWKL